MCVCVSCRSPSNRKRCRLVTAWDLRNSEKRTKRFPFFVEKVGIEKDKAVLFHQRDGDSAIPSLVHIWDLSSDQVQTIGSLDYLVLLWHMDVDVNVLVTFEIALREYPPRVYKTKWTLTGQLLDRTCFDIMPPDWLLDEEDMSSPPSGYVQRTSWCAQRTLGHKTVQRLYFPADDKYYMVDFIYDSAIDKLNLRWMDYSLPDYAILLDHCPPLTTCMVYHWMDPSDPSDKLDVYDVANDRRLLLPYQPDNREVKIREWLDKCAQGLGSRAEASRLEIQLYLLGDRETLCFVSGDGIQFWFFNPDFVPDLPDITPFVAAQ